MNYSPELLKALGPLADLFDRPENLEIMVDNPERVLVEIHGQLQQTEVRFGSAEEIRQIVKDLLKLMNDSMDDDQAVVQIRFPGSVARAVAAFPPVAPQGPTLVIRKLINRVITWEKLLEYGSINQEMIASLQRATQAGVNMLISGGTGAGKTTVANMVADMIPAGQRLVVAEEMHEMQIQHPLAVFLEAAPKLSKAEVIRLGSIMRPDWLIIGELFGSEALQVLEIFGRGHAGLTTMHATSVADALQRLEAMCLMGNPGLGIGEIRQMICSAFQLITHQRKYPDGRRRISEISDLCGLENGRYVLQPLFRYDDKHNQFIATGVKASWEA